MSQKQTDPEHSASHLAGKCIRCLEASAPDPLGLYNTCSVQVRVELAAGLRRLTEYLARWAAFDEWCRTHGTGSAAA